MKTTNALSQIMLSLVVITGGLSVANAAEPAVNIDFQSGGNTYTGLGVLGSGSDTIWNSVGPFGGGGTNLNYADGSGPSGVSVTTTHANSFSNGTQPSPLLIDWIYTFNLQETITISGLTPNATFDIAFYNGFYWHDFTIASQPGPIAQVRPPGTASPCGSPSVANSCNATMSGVFSDGAGVITITATALPGGCCGPASTIAGMQILRTNLVTDTDGDGIGDDNDNCPDDANPLQENNDGDALGDICDPDDDNDGAADINDNCPITSNLDQVDDDFDGLGNACDTTYDVGSVAQHVESVASGIVTILTSINVSGGNGMISKLTGNGGVTRKIANAVAAYEVGAIDTTTYLSDLQTALSKLTAFDNQLSAKIGNGKIAEPDASTILAASAELRATINGLIMAAGG